MKNNEIKTTALALCGVLALCGCSQKSSSDSTTQTSSDISSVESSTENSSSSSAVSAVSSVSSTSSAESVSSSESSSNTSSSTTETSSVLSTATNEPVQSTSSSVEQTVESEPPLEWTENSYSAVMYVNTDCYSRVKPILGFTKASLYHINDKVNVVAKTNTDYYKLDNGEFISVDYLSTSKVTVQSSSSSTSSSKSSSSSSISSRHSDIVYIDIGSSIGRPLSDYFN